MAAPDHCIKHNNIDNNTQQDIKAMALFEKNYWKPPKNYKKTTKKYQNSFVPKTTEKNDKKKLNEKIILHRKLLKTTKTY